ncbi:zinc finger protein 875-like [Battus philenor]|uniref:zinc finger protein 875-like n=1 Tax=Battus philenor TaxID=42288 RepID=UPI0035CFE4BA
MEQDDDMIVVIVCDENEENPDPVIKQELIDEEDEQRVIENLIDTAEAYGEVIPFEDVFIKQEAPDFDNLEEPIKTEIDYEYDDDDMDYVPEEDEEDEEDNIGDNSDSDGKEKQRYTMVKPWQRKSFVKELRQQYPELRTNKKDLIKTLSQIMKTVKPPAPPLDYYIMNGIMLECLYCHSLSETIPAAGRHYQEKHGPRYLICYACGVDFRSTTNLYKHEKRCNAPDASIVLQARALCLGRNGEKRPYPPMMPSKPLQKYSCEQCSAEFISKNNLLSHEYLHLGIRPFQCTDCPSAYTSRSALSRHSKKHSNVQYVCDHCRRVFKVKAALATHMNTHSAEKRFVCEECGKRYAQKFALQLHVDSRHRRLPPPCACHVCPKRFRRTSVLKEHMKKAHGMELITRKMFFKTLPRLTDMQIKHAKVVLKSQVAVGDTPQEQPS